MPKQSINPPTLFNSIQYGFSQIVTSTGGTTVYLSGQVAWDENETIIGPGDLKAQTWQTFKNIETALATVGGQMHDVVSMRIYIVETQMVHNEHVSAGLRAWFSAENAPATTWIGVRSLANPDFLIEIEATAIIESPQSYL